MKSFYWMRQKKWSVIPWLLSLALVVSSCEGPYSPRSLPPEIVPTEGPIQGKVIYQDGMPGLIEKTIDLVDELKRKNSLSSPLSMAKLRALLSESKREHKINLERFDTLDAEMKRIGVPSELLLRLQADRSNYIKKYQTFEGYLKELTSKPLTSEERLKIIERLTEFLNSVRPLSHHTPLEPNRLPYARLEPVDRQPFSTPGEYANWLGLPELSPGTPIAAPTPDDLKETEDIQFTPGIRALASKLKTPLAIFRWVYDNVEFYPGYGSIQGAEYCRMTRKCNAFDTASLLIALLRSQNIPARYVFGTVEVPLERARNWVGPFSDDSGAAVARALASAGIPATAIISGGKPVAVRMEHVWVEAWIDYIPSRGKVHRQGDTWIPMDPSFKQYNYASPSFDFKKATKVDWKATLDKVKKRVKEDPAGGILNPPDLNQLQSAVKTAQTNLKNSIKNGANYTVEGVIGKKRVQPYTYDFLLASLPYRVKVVGQRMAKLPEKLRYYLRVGVVSQVAPSGPWGFGGDPAPDFRVKISLPEIAGRKLSLVYNPASSADRTAVEKYAKSSGGSKNSFVKRLPSAIRVRPVLMLDDKQLASGKGARLGADNRLLIDIIGPGVNERISNTIVAGSYQAIVPHLGAVALEHLQGLKSLAKQFENQAKSKQIKVSREEFFGTLLHASGLNYWYQQDFQNRFAAVRFGVLDIRKPALGLFSYDLSVTYTGFLVSTPVSVSNGGFSTDIDYDPHAIISYSGDRASEIRYMLVTGSNASAWEAITWETFLRPKKPDASRGISASHLILYAAQNNVPIYTIRRDNLSSVLPKLSLSRSVINDIRSAVAAGKTVIVPQRQLQKDKWKGVGYIVLDEQTGAGAYMISGGIAGGQNSDDGSSILISFLIGVLLVALGVFPLPQIVGILLAAVGILYGLSDLLNTLDGIYNNPNLTDEQKSLIALIPIMMFAIGTILSVIGIFAGALLPYVVVALYVVYISAIISIITSGIIGIAELLNRRYNNLPLCPKGRACVPSTP